MGHQQHEDPLSDEPLLDLGSSADSPQGIHAVATNPKASKREGLISAWTRYLCPLGAYCCCQVAYQGIFTSLVLYLKRVRQEDNATAAATVTAVLGTGFCTSFFGAFLSDGYLGRLWTSVLILNVLLLGCTLLSIITQLQFDSAAFFTVSLYLTGLGYAWFKPGLAALGGDQFDSPQERNSFYNRLFVAGTVGEIFALTVVTYLENAGRWALGYWICTGAVGIGVLCLLGMSGVRYKPRENPFTRILQVVVAATRNRTVEVPADSQALYEPLRGAGSESRIVHTDKFRFLDKAAAIVKTDTELEAVTTTAGAAANPWKLCSVTQVEEVKSLARILPLWLTLLCKAAATSQLTSLFVEQGDVMDAMVGSFEIAPASMTLFNMIARIVFAIAFDYGKRLYSQRRRNFSSLSTESKVQTKVPESQLRFSSTEPLSIDGTRRRNLAPSTTSTHAGTSSSSPSRPPSYPFLQISIAFVTATLAMLVAAAVEAARLAAFRNGTTLSILWLVPQYLLEGVALVCGVVGEADFFYAGVQPGIRGLSSSLPVLYRGLGSYISSLLVTVVTAITTAGGEAGWIASDLDEGHLDYYFLLLAGIMLVDFIVFLGLARRFSYPTPQEEENKATR